MTVVPDFWAADRGEYTPAWIDLYWTSQDKPHRLLLLQELVRLKPASVLEVGCHCGINLKLLAGALPGVRLAGVDVSGTAVEEGRVRLAAGGCEADLRVGRAPEALAAYPDASVDCAFSCYTLAHLNQSDARRTLAEMWRISRGTIVLFEPTAFRPDQCEAREGLVYADDAPASEPMAVLMEWRHPWVHCCMWEPTMHGALATVIETSFPDSRLNALIVVQR